MTGQFSIDPNKVLFRWVEDHGGMKFYYVAHVRDGRRVYSYSNYADPLDSNAIPLASASSLDTETASPLTNIRLER